MLRAQADLDGKLAAILAMSHKMALGDRRLERVVRRDIRKLLAIAPAYQAANFVIGGLTAWAVFTLASLVLGIGGLCQKGRKKGFAICGVTLSGFFMLAVLAFALAVIR